MSNYYDTYQTPLGMRYASMSPSDLLRSANQYE